MVAVGAAALAIPLASGRIAYAATRRRWASTTTTIHLLDATAREPGYLLAARTKRPVPVVAAMTGVAAPCSADDELTTASP